MNQATAIVRGPRKVLACDTSTMVGSVALVEDGVLTAEIVVVSPRKGHHSRRLLADVQAVLDRREITVTDLDLLVTSVGPGSFTGVRIAISTMKGLAAGLGIPLWGATSLDALARPLLGHGLPVIAALDARKREVYAALYSGKGTKVEGPSAIAPAAMVREWCAGIGPVIGVGEGVLAYRDTFESLPGLIVPETPFHHVRASFVAMAALASPIHDPVPAYLRRSEAESAAGGGSSGRG